MDQLLLDGAAYGLDGVGVLSDGNGQPFAGGAFHSIDDLM
jgi:hypothetical protein